MPITDHLARFYTLLANMGLVLRDDPPKVIDMAGREWGKTVNGMALSIRKLPDAVLSVVLKNFGPEPRAFIVPGWLFFYEVQTELPLTPYGRELLKSERKTERIEITLGPAEARETDLPSGALYDLHAPGDHQVRVTCKLPDGTVLVSNAILI